MLAITPSVRGSRGELSPSLMSVSSCWTRRREASMAGRFSRSADTLLDALQSRPGQRGHLWREGDVAEIRAEGLAAGEAPRHEALERRPLLLVRIAFVQQEPGQGKDGVGLGALRIGQV